MDDHDHNPIKLKLMTWNILAQRYWHKQFLLFIDWKERLGMILKEINESDSNIVCLQEVDLKIAKANFFPLFNKYDCVIQQKHRKRSNGIGNMILWKKTEWKLDSEKFNSTGVHAVLTNIEMDKKLWVSNIHLKAGRNTGEDTRVNQLNSTLKFITNAAKNIKHFCIVGDFNDDLLEERRLYKMLKEAKLNIHFSPDSCFVYEREKGREGRFYKFDHIVTTSDIEVVLESDKISASIPNKDWPSDHFSVEYLLTLQ